MTSQGVLTIAQGGLQLLLLISAPLLLTALIVGLGVSIFQAATQINEPTLSFLPKLIALIAVLIVAGPWILSITTDYIARTLTSIPGAIG
jgi:flagellar biosynthesis protein FliQ